MKKKQKFTLSNSKIFLLTTLILVLGVLMLFFSIFFAPSQNQSETVLENIVAEKEETTKESIKTESVKTDPVKTNPVKTAPVKTESVKTNPIKTDPIKVDVYY